MNNDFLFWLVLIFAVLAGISIWRSAQASKKVASSTTSSTPRAQMVEDIKSTQTSRVSDAVEILDELSGLNKAHRQYCELIGTSQKEGGVIAPYSQRPVAYYDVRCYKIEYRGGQEVETLVAQESSIDPFYFKDASCDTPVYIDLASFGSNVILVNSTNHIEGPNSEFAQAVSKKISTATKGGGSASLAIVGGLMERLGNVLIDVRDALDRVLLPNGAPAMQLAYAGADGSSIGSNLMYAKGYNKMGSQGKLTGGGRPQMPGSRGNVTINLGDLGSFLGNGYGYGGGLPMGGFPMGGYGYGRRRGYDLGDAMLDIGLGALLGSLSNMSRQTASAQTTTPQTTFRGYRLVENVVPLGSPVYCIGELYRHGADIYMGASASSEYATSFFATKPEAEVLSHLGAK